MCRSSLALDRQARTDDVDSYGVFAVRTFLDSAVIFAECKRGEVGRPHHCLLPTSRLIQKAYNAAALLACMQRLSAGVSISGRGIFSPF